MANLNKVLLIGNLTRDPELRYTPSGTAVGEMGLAINRRYKDRNSDEWREEVCYVDITVWGRRGEVCCEYLSKGRPVFVEGRLQLDSWETQEGQKRSKLRVVADNVQFLDRRPGGEGRDDSSGGGGGGGGGGRPARGGDRPPQDDSVDDEVPF
jgi:single-strand DNA-binding protein